MSMRDRFISTAAALLEHDARTALVLADISSAAFDEARTQFPDRVVNVGIREQLMIGVAGGLAMTGFRPIAHSYATFVVDRAYEQLKLDLDHQDNGAILVSVGASYDGSRMGRTHFSPEDVALIDTFDGWTVHVPGHPDEVEWMLRSAAARDDRIYIRLHVQSNAAPHADFEVVRDDGPTTVFAVGVTLDRVVEASRGLPVRIVYLHTVRPLDPARIRRVAGDGDVVIVEPYLEGTSARLFAEALSDRARRFVSVGVGREDLHRYGDIEDHDRWHGLDVRGIRSRLEALVADRGVRAVDVIEARG